MRCSYTVSYTHLNEKRAELETRFSKAFIDKSAAYIDHISTAMEAASAIGAGVADVYKRQQVVFS